MTKLRAPESIEDAVTQAKALLGGEAIASALTGRNLRCSVSLIDKWADADQAQKPSLEQVLAIEAVLIAEGHAPIFVDLFTRLQPQAAQAADAAPPDPLREAMRGVKAATDLMDGVDKSMIDGRLDRAELSKLEHLTQTAQKQLARFRRVVRRALDLPRAR